MKRIILAVFLVMQVVLTIGFSATLAYGLGHDRAPQGLNLAGADLSNLNEEQALSRLHNEYPTAVMVKDKIFPLQTQQSFALMSKRLDSQYTHPDGTVTGTIISYLRRSLSPVAKPPVYLERQEIWPQLEKIKATIDQAAQPASIAYSGGQLVRKAGQPGLQLDLEDSWQKLLAGAGQSTVSLVVKTIPAQPGSADVDKIRTLLGDYTTYFNPAEKDRTNNVRLAARALDGHLVAPGAEFSFNQTVGERSEQVGYLPAYIFAGQEVLEGDGGGVCQDSSTLYQAVRQAHLQVVERNTHSLPVTYVPKGQDATVAYGTLDFRFRNDTQGYLLISAQMGINWLRVRIFGVADQTHGALAHPEGYPLKPPPDNGQPNK